MLRAGTALVTLTAVGFVLPAVPAAATNGDRSRTGQRVVIEERGSLYPVGRFTLKSAVTTDAGTADVRSFEGPLRTRDGQYVYTAHGTDTLRGRRGTLTLTWSGDHVDAGQVFVETGSWRVVGGTGAYARWRGGGRYAAVLHATSRGFSFTIQREGLISP